jgi:membrane-bound metal-dependent hydrolase YbcI (DUF457 family)
MISGLEVALQKLESGSQEKMLEIYHRHRSWLHALLVAALCCIGFLVYLALRQQPFGWPLIEAALAVLQSLLLVLLAERLITLILELQQLRRLRLSRAHARQLAEILPLLSRAPESVAEGPRTAREDSFGQ